MAKRAKARLIYPDICASERVGSLGAKGIATYCFLISAADDQGRLQGSPRRLKVVMLAFADDIGVDDIEQALAKMVEVGLVVRYEADGKSLIQLTDWWEWQHGLRHREPSRYPAPEGWSDQVSEGAQRDTGGRFTQKPKAPTAQPKGEIACPDCGVIAQPIRGEGQQANVLFCPDCRYGLADCDADGHATKWAYNVEHPE